MHYTSLSVYVLLFNFEQRILSWLVSGWLLILCLLRTPMVSASRYLAAFESCLWSLGGARLESSLVLWPWRSVASSATWQQQRETTAVSSRGRGYKTQDTRCIGHWISLHSTLHQRALQRKQALTTPSNEV